MKIHVVKDESGKVIASFEVGAANEPTLRPVLQEGHKTEEVDVPENYLETQVLYSGKNG